MRLRAFGDQIDVHIESFGTMSALINELAGDVAFLITKWALLQKKQDPEVFR